MKNSKLCINCKKRPAIFTMIRTKTTQSGRRRQQAAIRRDSQHPYCRQCQQSFRDKTQSNVPRTKLRR